MVRYVFALCLLFTMVGSKGWAVSIDAASMVLKSAGSVHDGSGWKLDSNNKGFIGTMIRMESAAPVTVTISADGQGANGELPAMDLHVAGEKAAWPVADNGGSHTVYSDYSATFALPAGIHYVRVEFPDDGHSTPGDRCLYLKRVTLTGASLSLVNSLTKENVLAASDSYIRNYRSGPVRVTLQRIGGAPVAEGTAVQAKLRHHEFKFGTSVYGTTPSNSTWTQPNPPAGSNDYYYQQFINSHFNTIVPENAFKWESNEATRDVVTTAAGDAMFDYAESHGMRARMHTCLWQEQEPAWVMDLKIKALTDPVAREEYREEISERIDYYIADRAGRYVQVDGINESVHQSIHTQLYGISGVADIYNEMAQAADGRAQVFVNEFGVLNSQSDPYANWYRQHIRSILNAGGTVDGIGVQAHVYAANRDSVSDYKALQSLAGFGRPVMLSEFSCDDDDKPEDAAQALSDLMRLTFGNDQTEGFIFWGFWPGVLWRQGAALVDLNWNLTPAGIAYEALMNEWNTEASEATDANGAISFNGFYGNYDVTVDGWPYDFKAPRGADGVLLVGDAGAPFPPTKPSVSVVTSSYIRWNWLDNSSDETGFRVYADAGSDPPTTLRTTRSRNVRYWVQTGLAANTRYSMQVGAINASGSSIRTPNLTIATRVLPPVYGASGDRAIACDKGPGGGESYSSSDKFLFKAVNGLGEGPTRAYKYGYVWDTSPTVPQGWMNERFWRQGDLLISPKPDGTYYIHIRAYDPDGVANPTSLTLGPYVVYTPIADTKLLPEGASVTVADKVVSAVLHDCMYIQEPNRSCGIRVNGFFDVSPGARVSVSGTLGLNGSEAAVMGARLLQNTEGTAPRPLAMRCSALGGASYGLQPAVVDDCESGRTAVGASSAGLLVRTSGRVGYVDPELTYCYIDDGSGIRDGSGHTGVRLSLEYCPVPEAGAFATVTACCAATTVDGDCARYLRPRYASDVHFSAVAHCLANPGFETGVAEPWILDGVSADGSVRSGTWLFSVAPHSGSRFFGMVGNYAISSGTLYQRVSVPAADYTAGVWSMVLHGANENEAATNRIGIDPTGGVDPRATTVVWSEWDVQSTQYSGQWRELTTPRVTCPGGLVTVFLDYRQQNEAGWHINCFDDATLTAAQ